MEQRGVEAGTGAGECTSGRALVGLLAALIGSAGGCLQHKRGADRPGLLHAGGDAPGGTGPRLAGRLTAPSTVLGFFQFRMIVSMIDGNRDWSITNFAAGRNMPLLVQSSVIDRTHGGLSLVIHVSEVALSWS